MASLSLSETRLMIHLPFADRTEAGRLLAVELSGRKMSPNAIVPGIARGGVPRAFAVAHHLQLPLDVVVASGQREMRRREDP